MSRYKAYPEYKHSGVEWLGNIPRAWDCVRLKFASELSSEKVAPSNQERYVGLENVQSNSGKFIATEEVTPEGISNAFSCGDVLFGKLRPYLAKSWLADFSGMCSSEFLVMTSRKVDSKFLHYFTLTEEFIQQVDSSTYGSKMPRASWEFIGLLDIPVPSHESEKIAAFLDHETAKIDALIEKQQRLIELLKEKRQAVISHAVTKGLNPNAPMKDSGVEWLGEVPAHWEVRRMKYVVRAFEQGWSPQCESRPAEGSEFGVLKVGCVNGGVFNPAENKALPSELPPQTQYVLKQGDLLVSRANTKELVGSAAVVEANFDNLILCDKLYRLRFSFNINPHLVSFYLSIPSVRQQIELGTSGASDSMQNISQSIIKELPVLIPPGNEADSLVDEIKNRLTKFDEVLSAASRQIAFLQERRTALISAAVTGKIDVRDWQAAA